ncbi:hypothetical protein HHK36_011743 [Tetracentron sinense]|uniref:Pentatricopeptide repeat-containing protein n=1 Tax=Tetracentron sinense TaxID=13715 RepID=A0A835DKQ1_TETSI|nr:hypothetical protein HHK36_011743 [Tetracentron sinense]
MSEKDVASWNAMIMGFDQLGFLDRVLILFYEMRFMGLKPDSITVKGLTQLSSYEKNLNMVKVINCFGNQIGIGEDVSVINTWIAAYAKCNNLGLAEKVFHGIPTDWRTVVSWNSMIGGYAYLEKFVKAISFYQLMCRSGVRPDISTILSLISSSVHPEVLIKGKLIDAHGIRWDAI